MAQPSRVEVQAPIFVCTSGSGGFWASIMAKPTEYKPGYCGKYLGFLGIKRRRLKIYIRHDLRSTIDLVGEIIINPLLRT